MRESLKRNSKSVDNESPFRGDLTDSEFSGKIKNITANPDFLVREYSVEGGQKYGASY